MRFFAVTLVSAIAGPIGGARDENGCIKSAGYVFCAKQNSCVRPWKLRGGAESFDAECAVEQKPEMRLGSNADEHGCVGSAGYVYCAKKDACVRPWALKGGVESFGDECGMDSAEHSNGPVLGADRDEHDCVGSAGYVFCAKQNACVRPWDLDTDFDEACTTKTTLAEAPPVPGGDLDAHGCKASAGFAYCSELDACVQPWKYEKECPSLAMKKAPEEEPLLGGDLDKNGCKPSAGFLYCEELDACVQPWKYEKECPSLQQQEERVCCMALIPSCNACAQGLTLEEYCAAHEDECREFGELPPSEPQLEEPVCCKAMTPECMACAARQTLAEFCRENKDLCEQFNHKEPRIGGGLDAHGCKASAGYVYCAKQDACVRPWTLNGGVDSFAKECSNTDAHPILGADEDEHGCKASAGFAYCAELEACVQPWEQECASLNAHPHSQNKFGATKATECKPEQGWYFCEELNACVLPARFVKECPSLHDHRITAEEHANHAGYGRMVFGVVAIVGLVGAAVLIHKRRAPRRGSEPLIEMTDRMGTRDVP